MTGRPIPESISTRVSRIAELAREDRSRSFLNLSHYIDIGWLREAYRRTRKDGAVGVDGQTAQEYEQELEGNLQSLLERLKSGRYRAPAVRRVNIPKGDGRSRPIGIPTFEDKVLQRAVSMVLEAVYEQDFLACSYGFRPGRSPHEALEAVWHGTMRMGGGWVLEVDIQSFFDELDHRELGAILDLRIRDGVIRRTINKWLRAGVWESGALSHPERGTPQGGVISPMLSNIYLHEVVDVWFEREVKPRLRGEALLIRFADDLVMVFERHDDAVRVQEVLPKRLGRFGLRLHPDKTRLVPFGRPRPATSSRGGGQHPGKFDFLGFTHYWGKSRRGRWVVQRKTAKSRLRRAVVELGAWCRRHRHAKVRWQWRELTLKLRGHYAYYGITGNYRALSKVRFHLRKLWRKWLARRSQRGMTWERFNRLEKTYPLPRPKIYHSAYTA